MGINPGSARAMHRDSAGEKSSLPLQPGPPLRRIVIPNAVRNPSAPFDESPTLLPQAVAEAVGRSVSFAAGPGAFAWVAPPLLAVLRLPISHHEARSHEGSDSGVQSRTSQPDITVIGCPPAPKSLSWKSAGHKPSPMDL